METQVTAGAFQAIAKKQPSLQRKADAYQAHYDQWERDRLAYIAKHGQAAWDAKVDREVEELYGEEIDWRCRTKP